jgi:ABC-type transport system involved in cytochrome bd biosynthesis fused ATPase/permease subunit
VVRRVLIISLGWIQALALATLYICVGRAVGWVDGSGLNCPDLWLLLAMVASVLVAGLAAGLGPRLAAGGQAADESAERGRVLGQVFALGAAERSRERAGAIVSTATDGVERAAAYRNTFLGPMIGSMTAPLLVLLMMGALVDWVVAGLTAVALPVIPVALGGFQAAFAGVSRRYRENGRVFAAKFLDAIQGLPTLRLINADRLHGRSLAAAAEELRRHVMRLLAGNQLMLFVVDSLFSLAFIAAVAGLSLWRIAEGAINPGEGLALVLCGTLLLDPLDRIGQFFYIGMGGIASAKEIKTFLAEEPAVVDPGSGGVTARQGPEWSTTAPAVELDRVDFAYGSGPAVLADFSLTVQPGEHVAIIGPSGAGKTTIAEILQGNLRPDAGRVRLFGVDVMDLPLGRQRAGMAVVAQHSYLFTGSLRDNLLVGDQGADDDRLFQALAAADLADFVAGLPLGLDTAVGERGLALSGGQTQRLGIARAFLADAPILVLDEPTAHVDLAAERAILASLETIGEGKTVIAISHRRATIAHADRVAEVAA